MALQLLLEKKNVRIPLLELEIMDIYLATGNIHKIRELKGLLDDLLEGLDIKIHSAEEVGGMPEVDEVEDTLEGNARLKAQALLERIPNGAWVLADDSGLFVDALGGLPGVLSARYSVGGDGANRRKLLKALENMPEAERGAEFICCFVLLNVLKDVVFKGKVRGVIAKEESGSAGFGYDAIFIAEGQNGTFAEIGSELKNRISHRGDAVRQLVSWLKEKRL